VVESGSEDGAGVAPPAGALVISAPVDEVPVGSVSMLSSAGGLLFGALLAGVVFIAESAGCSDSKLPRSYSR